MLPPPPADLDRRVTGRRRRIVHPGPRRSFPSSPFSASEGWWRPSSAPSSTPAPTPSGAPNNYGPQQHPEKLIPLAILNALMATRSRFYGDDGSQVRNWLFVRDFCTTIKRVLDQGGPDGSNVGGPDELPNIEGGRTILERPGGTDR